jgi:predicted DNA-binding protein YlxM (UPF0122 family)
MEKLVEITLLLDFYGNLLTEKQRRFLGMHCNQDMSLSEIAEAEGISPQAVSDLRRRTGKILLRYEDALKLAGWHREHLSRLQEILGCLGRPGGEREARDKLSGIIDAMRG